MFGLLTWISILISHISFICARKAQNIPDSALAYVAPLGKRGSFGALIFSSLILLFKGFALFAYKKTAAKGTVPKFDTSTFVTTYLGLPVYLILFFGYKFFMKSKLIKPQEARLGSMLRKCSSWQGRRRRRVARGRKSRRFIVLH